MSDLQTRLAYQNGWIDGQRSARGGGLYTRADVEAAVKRALEEAAEQAAKTYIKSATMFELGVSAAEAIRALDPAQFIDGETND